MAQTSRTEIKPMRAGGAAPSSHRRQMTTKRHQPWQSQTALVSPKSILKEERQEKRYQKSYVRIQNAPDIVMHAFNPSTGGKGSLRLVCSTERLQDSQGYTKKTLCLEKPRWEEKRTKCP